VCGGSGESAAQRVHKIKVKDSMCRECRECRESIFGGGTILGVYYNKKY